MADNKTKQYIWSSDGMVVVDGGGDWVRRSDFDLRIAELERQQSSPSLCRSCEKRPAEPLHTCPHQEDRNDDSEAQCNCCAECQYRCTMDA